MSPETLLWACELGRLPFALYVGFCLAANCWENRVLHVVIADVIFAVEHLLALCILFTGVHKAWLHYARASVMLCKQRWQR